MDDGHNRAVRGREAMLQSSTRSKDTAASHAAAAY